MGEGRLMFNFGKKNEKERELIIYLIQEFDTVRLQHEYLFNRIRDLEARVEKLEPKEEMKIDVFAGEGVL